MTFCFRFQKQLEDKNAENELLLQNLEVAKQRCSQLTNVKRDLQHQLQEARAASKDQIKVMDDKLRSVETEIQKKV